MTTTIKKAFTAVVAMVMALVLMVPAGAAYAAGTGSITITPPTGTASDTLNTYKIYKVFDADGNGTNISYKLCSGDTLTDAMKSAGFSVDSAGNVSGPDKLDQTAIAAIASYVNEKDPVATATSKGTAQAKAENLPNGYYYITTSTGTAVTINSTNPDVEVNDKNTVPAVTKKITSAAAGSVDDNGLNAIAQAGSTVSYESDITVPANTKNLKFSDPIASTQTLETTSVAIKVNGTAVDASNYTLTTTDNAININFVDSYIKTLSSNTKIVVTYTTTVNSDALSSDPSTNTATITYGDNNAKVTSTTTSIYNAKITVTKSFEGLTGELANGDSAQFVLKNAGGKYYSISNDGVVSWVDSDLDATKLTYTQTGSHYFTGLADGTYTLVESQTPAGYKTAANQTITVANGNYTAANLEQTATVVNQTGSALPSTGGMGTMVLYAVGAALVITAGALLIARKRNTQE